MKLNLLSDQALLQQTLLLVKREKEVLSQILQHLQEVQRRRLFCDLGFGSLFQYCVKHLGYSEDQSYRRVNALKIVKAVPEIQEKIAKGELTLSTLGVAQTLFRADATIDKRALLEALGGKSKREAEKIVHDFSPKIRERKKEVKLFLNLKQEEKWQAVRAKLAHCNLIQEEILERLCDLYLEPVPQQKHKKIADKSETKDRASALTVSNPLAIPAPSRSPASPKEPRVTKSIPVATKRLVRERSENHCENCGSNFALEIDHILPRACEGSHHPNNLRVLCRSCNQRAAIRIFGVDKMQRFLGS